MFLSGKADVHPFALCVIIKTSNWHARRGKELNTNAGLTVASQEVAGELVSCAIVSEEPLFLCSSRTPPCCPLERAESDNQWKRKKRGKNKSERKIIHLMCFFFMGGWTGFFIMTCIPPLTSLIERFRKTPWPLAFRTIGSGMFPSVRKPGQQQEHEGAHGKATVYCETGWEDLFYTHTSKHTFAN